MTGRQQPRRMFRYADTYLTVDPALAQAIGLDEAIVLTRISYLLHLSVGKAQHTDEGGTTWVWNSYDEWRGEHFPFFTKSHVTEVIRKLEREGLLVSRQRTSHDRRKLYTIDYAAVDERVGRTMSPTATMDERAGMATSPTATMDERAQGATPAVADRRGRADAPGTTSQETGHVIVKPADAEKPARQAKETEGMNAESPVLQGGGYKPPCEGNPRLQGRETARCYRDTIQQTTLQNTRQDGTVTRQRMLSGFRVSERVAGYV